MKSLYGVTLALSAFLLFSVEPMIARTLLPILGGSSAVWMGSLAFFQVALLAGYGYAFMVAPASDRRPAVWSIHLGLLLIATLVLLRPLPFGSIENLSGSPELRLFALLSLSVGLPFILLSTTAPLLQVWYARREGGGAVPYRFYGLSNLASLVALFTYPVLVEPNLSLTSQFRIWKAGFVLYVLLTAVLTLRLRSATVHEFEDELTGSASRLPPRSTRLLWFALPAVAAFQLAAVTAHLTEDVASLPLLWIMPLAAYLLSFVLAFELPRFYNRFLVVRLLAVLLFALGYFLAEVGVNVPIVLSIVLFTAELFFAAWFCHAELFSLRPGAPAASSSFYLHIAAGGALGTLAIAVFSPLVTDSNLDLPMAFVLIALILLARTWSLGWAWRALWAAGSALGVCLLVFLQMAFAHDSLLRARNFYGSVRVKETQSPPQAQIARTLYNGKIQHGMQWFSPAFRRVPLTYYEPDSGVGLALSHCCESHQQRKIGVVGLGAGTLAAYGQPGDTYRFYEINPLVTDVATHLFTYTRDTPAKVDIIPGDARISLTAEPPQRFDVLVVDAFSGDSIPVHLLTAEAFALYRRHLAPGGVLAIHISNQYLDLAPVLARFAESTQSSPTPLVAREIDSAADASRGESLASWVLLSDRAPFFNQPAIAEVSHPLLTEPNVRLWTDQRSTLLPILRWTGRRSRR